MRTSIIAIFAVLIILPSFLSAQSGAKREYSGTTMPGTNLADYETYGWLPFIDSVKTDLDHASVDAMITEQIDKQMAQRGFKLVDENPQLMIQYMLAMDRSKGTKSKPVYGAPNVGVGVGFGWGRPSFSLGMSGPKVVGQETIQVTYAHGTLIVGLLDVTSQTTVWRGTVSSIREDHGELINPKLVIEEVIPTLFKEFPKVKRKKK